MPRPFRRPPFEPLDPFDLEAERLHINEGIAHQVVAHRNLLT
jgi:hypothetical protein